MDPCVTQPLNPCSPGVVYIFYCLEIHICPNLEPVKISLKKIFRKKEITHPGGVLVSLTFDVDFYWRLPCRVRDKGGAGGGEGGRRVRG